MSTRTLLTLAEYERLPEVDGMRHELDAGELVSMTMPKPKHNVVVQQINFILSDFVRRHRLGLVLVSEAGYLLSADPPTLRGPDVSFIADVSRIKPDQYIEGAPDLAVEVVSPSDTAAQITRKVSQYLGAGARTVWVVYPDEKEVCVFEAAGKVRVLTGADTLTAPALLPGFSVPVTSLFE